MLGFTYYKNVLLGINDALKLKLNSSKIYIIII